MVTFSEWLLETNIIKKPKNPITDPEKWYVNEKLLFLNGCYTSSKKP